MDRTATTDCTGTEFIPLLHKITMSLSELQKKLDDVVSSLGTAKFDVPTVSRDEIIQRMQARDPSIVLLDIRTDEERSTTIPGSIDISGEPFVTMCSYAVFFLFHS